MRILRFILCSLLFLANTSFYNNPSEKSPAEQRAEYIIYIIDHIQWPNESDISVFKIGVLENEPYISMELERLSQGKLTPKGKPIEIIHFPDIESLANTQMMYINRNEGYDIAGVLRKISGKNTLLISENYEFQTSMINFLILNNILRFEINLARMESEGFKTNPLFVALSVKSESDWMSLFHQVESLYFKEQETVQRQSIEIERQQVLIEEQLETISLQNTEIEKQQREIKEQTKRLLGLDSVIKKREREILATIKTLEEQNKQIEKSFEKIRIAEEDLAEKTTEIAQKELMIEEQDKQIFAQLQEIEKQKIIIFMSALLSLILIGLGYFIYRSYLIKKRANIILQEKNEQIRKQRDEIEIQRNIATEQRDTIAKQNKNIQDSITYARRIQEAVLPPKEILKPNLNNYFILNKPKEIVSGDYYWMSNKNDDLVIAAADCTGHGVPGAFMSMLGVAFLNEIVNKIEDIKANEILNMLREYVIFSLRQTGKSGEANDGMDIALCILNSKTFEVQYSGANNPMYIVRPIENVNIDNSVFENYQLLKENESFHLYRIKADIMPVAIHRRAKSSFSNHAFKLKQGDAFYIFSDGYIDQFGGPAGKRYSSSKFAQKILDIQTLSMQEQIKDLDIEIEIWKKTPDEKGKINQQIDDILVIGVKI